MAKSTSRKSTSGSVDALDYLAAPEKHPAQRVCAVYGDEAFLKSEVLTTLRRQVLAGEDAEFSLNLFSGREAQLRDVIDALSTVSLFGDGGRLVIVEEADAFITQYRAELEDFVSRPAKKHDAKRPAEGDSPIFPRGLGKIGTVPGGVLVLDVKTWPSNTRLAKAVAACGLTIHCETPKERQLKSWLMQRAKSEHHVRLDAAAADALLELVPPEVGILVQEVAKLALVAGEMQVIDVKLVRENVGGWRARATWDMIDAAAEGRSAVALSQLDRIISSGEKPQGILPQMASTLRRFATSVELVEVAEGERRRLPLREALAQAGVPPFKLNDAERQLRQLGRPRAKQLAKWLLAADLAMKSHNSADDAARIEIERLIVRLSAEVPQPA